MLDLILAIAHHLLVFALVAQLMGQRVLLKSGPVDVGALARLDIGFGATAGLVVVIGAARVILGARGWEFYEGNPFFWAKVATFAAIGVISITPTVRFAAWKRAAKTDPGFQPPTEEVARARTATGIEALLLVPLLAFAAAMARWPF